MLHILYYMLLGMLLLILLAGGYEADNPNAWAWSAFLSTFLGICLPFIPPMALIHWLARLANRRSRRVAEETRL